MPTYYLVKKKGKEEYLFQHCSDGTMLWSPEPKTACLRWLAPKGAKHYCNTNAKHAMQKEKAKIEVFEWTTQ
jgi:hypothetical protein